MLAAAFTPSSWAPHPVNLSPTFLVTATTFSKESTTTFNNAAAAPTALRIMPFSDDGDGDDTNEDYGGNLKNNNNTRNKSKHNNTLNLIATIFSVVGVSSSLGTLWSEYSVIMTGCGPLILPDALERGCYLGVLVLAGLSIFVRIVTWGDDLATTVLPSITNTSENKKSVGAVGIRDNKIEANTSLFFIEDFILWQLRLTEWLSLVAVLGAFVSLAFQIYKGEQMDGMSGINTDMCRALRDID